MFTILFSGNKTHSETQCRYSNTSKTLKVNGKRESDYIE